MTLFEIIIITYVALVYFMNLFLLIIFWGEIFEGVKTSFANVTKAILIFIFQPVLMLVLVPMFVALMNEVEEQKVRAREWRSDMREERLDFKAFLREKELKDEYEEFTKERKS